MKHLLPPLNALRAFEAAARHESFTRAAAELSVTHGAISRQVATLEAYLDVLLFERGHRAVVLTRSGIQLRDEMTTSFTRIAAASERAKRRRHGARQLRLSAPPAFSVRWLIPRLAGFQALHPGVEISLSNSVAAPEFAADEYDLAIRRFDRSPSRHHAVRLFAEFSIPVCRSDLIGRLDTPLALPDLLRRAPLLRVAAEPRGWEKWARAWRCDLAPARFVDIELTYLAVQAALEGLGVALLPFALAMDDIARGVLTMPLGPRRIDASTYFAVVPRPPAPRSAAARMIAWLAAQSGQLDRSVAALSRQAIP